VLPVAGDCAGRDGAGDLPLIALMEDQAAKLAALGLRVARIHSGLERSGGAAGLRGLFEWELQFLFIAPERLRVPGFAEMLAKKKAGADCDR
jgi:ATP-dependent DNA helicase RecQ